MRLAKLVPLALSCGAVALPIVTLPWFGQVSLDGLVGCLGYNSDPTEKTVYEVLKDDKQYSRLVKIIDMSKRVVRILSDPSESITFFAVPDSKLPHPRKPHHGNHGRDDTLVHFFAENIPDVTQDLGDIVRRAEELESEPDSRDKDKHKEALAHIIDRIVAYHILPGSYETAILIQNSTYATNLTLADGSMDHKPLRMSVLSTTVPPRLRINMFVEVTKSDIKAKNGILHQVNQPLLPPPSVFQETFSIPDVFSFFTSAIQRVDLTSAVDRWRYSRGDGKEVGFAGATATTIFAPTSGAFKRLPKKLKAYLFSPFGQKALRKLLEYHIVPDSVLYTDYFHNSTSDGVEFGHGLTDACASKARLSVPVSPLFDAEVEDPVFSRHYGPLPDIVYEYNTTLPTLVQDHFLQVHVTRYKTNFPLPGARYFTLFRVNGQHVGPFDIPARNGALHVLSTILDPRKGCHGHHCHHGNHAHRHEEEEEAWEDWEEWLPQWAMED